MGSRNIVIFVVALLGLIAVVLLSVSSGEDGTRITSDENDQKYPDIYGTKIVWQDDRNGHWDIYMYDLGDDGTMGTADDGGEMRITDNGSDQKSPKIHGNRIVWVDDRNENRDIYMYDLGPDGKKGTVDDGGEVRITNDSSNQGGYDATCLDIYGDIIVWEDYRNDYSGDIFMYDIGSGEEIDITNDTTGQNCPRVHDNYIVWYQNDGSYYPSNYNIYLYNTAENTTTKITTDSDDQCEPDVYGNRIVWQDDRDGLFDNIYLYDIDTDTETRIDPGDDGYQWSPRIYGNRIVWEDSRDIDGEDTGWNIFYYDIIKQRAIPVITVDGNQWHLSLHDKLLVWDDDRNEDSAGDDIYILNLGTPFADAGPDKVVKANEAVEFKDNSLDDGTIVSYSWDFDVSDGISEDAAGQTPTHTYTSNGIYIVTLTVTDDEDLVGTDTCVVRVAELIRSIDDPEGDVREATTEEKKVEGHEDIDITMLNLYQAGDEVIFEMEVVGEIQKSALVTMTFYTFVIYKDSDDNIFDVDDADYTILLLMGKAQLSDENDNTIGYLNCTVEGPKLQVVVPLDLIGGNTDFRFNGVAIEITDLSGSGSGYADLGKYRDEDDDDSEFPLWIFIPVVIGIVAIGVGIAVMKKRTAAMAPEQPFYTTEPPGPMQPTLYGVPGQPIYPAQEYMPPRNTCPSCGQPATYIEEYQRWYCYNCERYL